MEARGTPTSPWREPSKNRQYEGGTLHTARSVGHAGQDGVGYLHFVRCEAGLWTAQLIVSANPREDQGERVKNRSPAMFCRSPPRRGFLRRYQDPILEMCPHSLRCSRQGGPL